jgi:hypothetical protein
MKGPGQSHALLRIYGNGVRARITPRDGAFMLELYDTRGRRRPDLPVIASTLDEAQQLADDYAEVDCPDPWLPVRPGTFEVLLPEDSVQ